MLQCSLTVVSAEELLCPLSTIPNSEGMLNTLQWLLQCIIIFMSLDNILHNLGTVILGPKVS
jgi:hypothetical protein